VGGQRCCTCDGDVGAVEKEGSAASEVAWRLAAERAGGAAAHSPLWSVPGGSWRGTAIQRRPPPALRPWARFRPPARGLEHTVGVPTHRSAASREMTKEDARDGTFHLIESIRIEVTPVLIGHLSRELCGQSCTTRRGAQLAGRVQEGYGNTVTVASLWAPALGTVPMAASEWS